MEKETMLIGNKCPNCGSEQFSIIRFGDTGRLPDLDKKILGSIVCRGCHKSFFVRLAPELESAIRAIAKEFCISKADALINILFRGSFGEFSGS